MDDYCSNNDLTIGIKEYDLYKYLENKNGRFIPEFFMKVEFMIYRCVCKILDFLGIPPII